VESCTFSITTSTVIIENTLMELLEAFMIHAK
jgi:hypothetical protein